MNPSLPRKYLYIIVIILLIGIFYSLRFRLLEAAHTISIIFDPRVERLNDVATITPNISYCNSKFDQQRFDLYTPKGAKQTRPVVLYIHGGGWRSGNKQNLVTYNYGPSVIRSGYSFISMNYRLSPTYRFPNQPQDVACALRYIKQNARALGINSQRIVLMGDSAGGQLAAYIGLNPPPGVGIRGVVDLYGDMDLVALLQIRRRNSNNIRAYLGSRDLTLAFIASPSSYVRAGSPPFLIIHGENDKVVPLSQSIQMTKSLESARVPVTFIQVKHAGHAFGLRSRAQPNIPALGYSLESFLKEVD